MLQPIEGYFDGKHIVPLGEINTGGHYKVRITFLEELTPDCRGKRCLICTG